MNKAHLIAVRHENRTILINTAQIIWVEPYNAGRLDEPWLIVHFSDGTAKNFPYDVHQFQEMVEDSNEDE